MTPAKELRLDVRVRNNRLIRAREELGLTQAEASRQIGITPSELSAWENLKTKRAVLTTDGDWRDSAKRVAAFYGYSPEYLWPDAIFAIRKSALRLEANASDVAQLGGVELDAKQLSSHLSEALACLPPFRREVVVASIVDEKTLKDIGDGHQLSRERIRCIKEESLRRLRETLGSVDNPAGPRQPNLIHRKCRFCEKPFKTQRPRQTFCGRICISHVMRHNVKGHKHRAFAEADLWVWLDHEREGWNLDGLDPRRTSATGGG